MLGEYRSIKFLFYCVCCVGLEDEGLYRIVGVNSKVTKLTSMLLGMSVK